jgi:CheY-like chemotaxis protein
MDRVLIVDDDRDSRETLALLLRHLLPAQETLFAANGAIGIELAVLHRPTAVILDVEMPVCDGLQAARQLRTALGAAPLLIGVSGNSRTLQKGVDDGLFDYGLVKPILASELLDLLASGRRARRCLVAAGPTCYAF